MVTIWATAVTKIIEKSEFDTRRMDPISHRLLPNVL
jgi:hypothetical protein